MLIGPNGAGKSTAIKCIAGLLRFNGNIAVCGYPNKSVEAKRNFGYIPELPAPIETLTVYEHMEFIARAYKVEDWKDKAKNLLERMASAQTSPPVRRRQSWVFWATRRSWAVLILN